MQTPTGGGRPDPGEQWPLPGDPDVHVGARHHIVPRYYLERFASADRIAVVDPRTHVRRVAPVKDTALEKDFYTFVNTEGDLDGRLEQLLGKIEGDAAQAIRNITSVFAPDPTPEDRVSICLLLAFQMNRGRASRRRAEMLADMTTRLLADGIHDEQAARAYLNRQGLTVTPETTAAVIDFSTRLDDFEFAPDPNEHIAMIGELARDAMAYLVPRPWVILEFESPSLLTSDEPVSLYSPGDHDESEALGLENAEEIYFPLDPRRLLVLGHPKHSARSLTRLPGTPERAELANWLATYNAYESVFMHPDYEIAVPKMTARPLFRVSTDGSPVLERYNRAPSQRRTERRRRSDGARRA